MAEPITTPPHIELDDTLDFINTLEHSRDGDREHLPSLAKALAWLTAHEALASRPAAASEEDLARIRSARAAMREVADAVVLGRPADASALARINEVLATRDATELRPAPDGVVLAARHAGDPLADALAHLAEPLIELIAEGRADRLRVCASDSCRWVFYDTSRTARRRWCDMTTCGNRAKARRHRERMRLATEGDAVVPTL